MQSKSLGLILNTKPINDNNLYIKVLSVNDNILSGLVYGGNTSKKISIYQPGYFLEFNQIQKNSNSVNSITGEIVAPYIGNIYNRCVLFRGNIFHSGAGVIVDTIEDSRIIHGFFFKEAE